MTESRESALHVGIHGRYTPHPWLADNATTDADVFSLVTEAAEARGLSSSSMGGADIHATRWGHNDAGQDLRTDGVARQVGWLQVTPLSRQPGRLPVLPAAELLLAALHRLGNVHLTGFHLVADAEEGRNPPEPATERVAFVAPGSVAEVSVLVAGRAPDDVPADQLARSASSVMDDAQLVPIAVAAETEHSGWWRVVEDPADPSPARAVEVVGVVANADLESLTLVAETMLAAAYKAGMRGSVFVGVKLHED